METEEPTKEQLIDALSWAIHFGTTLPRGPVYDEAMKSIVDFYWNAKKAMEKEAR